MPRQQAQTSTTKRKPRAARRPSPTKRAPKKKVRPAGASGGAAPRRAPAAPRSAATDPAPINMTHLRFHLASLLRLSDNLVSKAVGLYDRLFALDQRDETAIYLELGKDLAREERFDEALVALRKVLVARPNDSEALFELGMIHLKRGAPQAAAGALEKAKKAGVQSHLLHLRLAEAHSLQENLDAALVELEAAIALKPEIPDGHYQRGILLDRLERYPEAVGAFETAIELDPTEIRYHQSLGFTLETMGQRKNAIRCFKRALELERSVTVASDFAVY